MTDFRDGAIWIPIIGDFSRTGAQIDNDAARVGRGAGRRLGQEMASGVEASRAAVEKATARVAAAQDKVADASSRTRVAEAKLDELRQQGITSGARYTSALEAVERAQIRQQAASRGAQRASDDLAAAQARASAAAADAANQTDEVGRRALVSADSVKKAGLVMGTAFAGASAALYGIATQFDDAADALRLAGAQGAELDSLTESVKRVAQATPAMDGGIAQIGETMATLRQRLGLTGPAIETVTSQMVQLANMGQEVDLNSLTGAMTAFGVKGTDTSKVLDELFRVSQSSGVGISELAASAIKGGPALRQFGFGLADSAALAGSLDKAGLDADKTIAAMNKSLVGFAKAGKDPKAALADTITEIQKLTSSGQDAAALNLAGKLFGTKGAGQFIDAVRSGAFSVAGLQAAVSGSGDGILNAASDTADFAEQWQLFKQKVLVQLEPLATAAFGAISTAMGVIATTGIPTVKSLAGGVAELAGKFGGVIDFVDRNRVAFTAVAGVITAVLLPQLIVMGVGYAAVGTAAALSGIKQVGAWIASGAAATKNAIVSVAASYRLVGAWIAAGLAATVNAGKTAAAWVVSSVGAAGATAKTLAYVVVTKTVQAATIAWTGVQWLLNAALNANPISLIVIAIAALVAGVVLAYKNSETFRSIVQAAWEGIKNAISVAWETVIKPIFGFFVDVIKGAGDVVSWLWNNAIVPAFNGIKAAIDLWWSGVQLVFGFWKAVITGAGDVVMWLWNNAITPAFNGIKAAIDLWWSGVQVVFNVWKSVITGVGDTVMWLWNNAITPAFDGIKTAISTAWAFIKPLFDKIGAGITGIGDIGSKIGGTLKSAFTGVVDVLKAPIHALGKILASVPTSVFGVSIPGAKTVQSWGQTLQNLRAGGPVSGPGTATSDSIPAMLSNGEFVEPAASVTPQTLPFLEAIRGGWVPPADLLHAMVPGFAAGGLVTPDQVRNFARGVDGKPYVWGGVEWGDCSGAVSAVANFATGRSPFASRFATGNAGQALSERGFKPGLGPKGSLNIGWFNGGPYGGHTAATLPTGENFEMGGQYGKGKFGGSVGANAAQFTDHAHLPPEFFAGGDQLPGVAVKNKAGSVAAVPSGKSPSGSASTPGKSSSTPGGSGSGGSAPVSLSQLAGDAASGFAQDTVKSTLDFFGLGKFADLPILPPRPEPGVTAPRPDRQAGPGTTPVAGAGGRAAPLVHIDKIEAHNPDEAAAKVGRETRRAVRSDALVGGR